MRELSQETGRRQLLSFIKFMKSLPSENIKILEIGNAYHTGQRTCTPAIEPRGPMIFYDCVIGLKYKSGVDISCYGESKVANTENSIKKLSSHLAHFIVDAYCTIGAWADNMSNHKPNFLFITNTPFNSNLLKHGKLIKNRTQESLEKEIKNVNMQYVDYLCENTTIFYFQNWLQDLIG